MAKVTLKSVQVEGFGIFKKKTPAVSLDAPGLVLVSGMNTDTLAASSNGAGKTTLFKAISWCLFGKTIDGLAATEVIHTAAAKAIVNMTFDIDGKSYELERTRKKTSTQLVLTRDGENLSQRRVADTQASVCSLLGMDWDGFRCCVLFGQGDTSRFASPTVTDAARKDVLSTILGLDVYERARERAREKRTQVQDRIRQMTAESGDVTDAIYREQRLIDRFEASSEQIERLRSSGEESLKELLRKRKDLSKDSDKLRDELAGVESPDDDASAEIAELDDLISRTSDASAASSHEWGACRKEVASAKSAGPCPTCGQARGGFDQERYDDAVDAEIAAGKKAKHYKSSLGDLRNERRECQAVIAENAQVSSRIESQISRVEGQMTTLAGQIDDLKAKLQSSDSDILEFDEKIAACRIKIKETERELDDRKSAIVVENKKLKAVEWWARTGFGPKGVPAFAIETALPALNARTNRHLADLTDGDISVTWTATRPSAKGTEIEELTCSVVIEGHTDVAASGGQMRKIELATELALAEVVAESGVGQFNVLFFDEALDGLDGEGRARVVEWLSNLPFPTIFVVSHTDEIADSFEHELLIMKKGGAATLADTRG